MYTGELGSETYTPFFDDEADWDQTDLDNFNMEVLFNKRLYTEMEYFFKGKPQKRLQKDRIIHNLRGLWIAAVDSMQWEDTIKFRLAKQRALKNGIIINLYL